MAAICWILVGCRRCTNIFKITLAQCQCAMLLQRWLMIVMVELLYNVGKTLAQCMCGDRDGGDRKLRWPNVDVLSGMYGNCNGDFGINCRFKFVL